MKAVVQTHAVSLAESLKFYRRLKFTVISPENPTIVSDGKVAIEINPDKFSRPGIKIYTKELSKWKKAISTDAPCHPSENGFITSSPEGTWLYFEKQPKNLDLDSKIPGPSMLGKLAGFTLETISIEHSLKFWNLLGFKVMAGSTEDRWVQMEGCSGFGIALMLPESCPHSVLNPSLTYFNGKDNSEIIRKIRSLKIPIYEEVRFGKSKLVKNIILRDPCGLGFFVFSD